MGLRKKSRSCAALQDRSSLEQCYIEGGVGDQPQLWRPVGSFFAVPGMEVYFFCFSGSKICGVRSVVSAQGSVHQVHIFQSAMVPHFSREEPCLVLANDMSQ